MSFPIEKKQLPLALSCQLGNLICVELLRDLPGKRAVFKGTLNDDLIIIKCFFGKKKRRNYLREYQGVSGFIRADIDTPELIFYGKVGYEKTTIYVVVTRFLEPSVSFDQLWKADLSEGQRLVWLYRITRLLGCLYRAGITPVDIHLDNLLVSEQSVYLIDGGGALVRSRALSRKKALDNFTLFMSVLAPRYEHFTHKLYLALASFSPEYAGASLPQVMAKVHQWRKWRERYLEKTLRSCSDFIAKKSFFRFQVTNRHQGSDALQAFLNSPEAYIKQSEKIKQGRTNTVVRVTLDNDKQVLVKRYRSTKRFSCLKMLMMSRARNSWLGAYLLKMLDIRTPTPLALLEHRIGPFVRCSYIVTDYIPGNQLLNYFDIQAWPSNWESVVRQVKDYFLSLERSLVAHGDMKATNFIVYKDEVYLIDLDSMVSCKTFKQYQPLWEKDCDRFMKNWQNVPDVAALFQSQA